MFDPDTHFDVPTGDLLAEIGIDPAAASEVIAEDRASRCPGREQVRPDPGTAFLDVVMPPGGVPCGAAPPDRGPGQAAEIPGPVPPRRQADWR